MREGAFINGKEIKHSEAENAFDIKDYCSLSHNQTPEICYPAALGGEPAGGGLVSSVGAFLAAMLGLSN